MLCPTGTLNYEQSNLAEHITHAFQFVTVRTTGLFCADESLRRALDFSVPPYRIKRNVTWHAYAPSEGMEVK
jgi:hypothetical protein